MAETSKTSIWFSEPNLEKLRQTADTFLPQTLGIEISQVGNDFLCGTMPVVPANQQPMGILHGGASVSLAETLGSMGAAMTLDLSKQHPVGLEINANHVRAVRTGLVTGKATPVHMGRKTQIWDIRIRNDEGKLTCISRLTVAILDNR